MTAFLRDCRICRGPIPSSLGVLHEIQEFAPYTHSSLVGAVNGIGTRRGDVIADPDRPLDRARTLGRRLFELRSTDHPIDTDRPGSAWDVGGAAGAAGAKL